MSSGIFRQNNDRKNNSGNVVLESNLGKLGILSEPRKPKKKPHQEGSKSHGATKSADSASHRTHSRDSSYRSVGDQSINKSWNWKSSRPMPSSIDMDQARRKDKTFLGGECAVCEEQLELTLRGERILQLSCGHIAHEACFYEYLREFDSHACPTCNAPLSLDSSRGGAVPNIDILTNAVRQGASTKPSSYAPSVNTQMPWEDRNMVEPPVSAPSPTSSRTENIPYLTRNRSIGATSDRTTPIPSEMGHSRAGQIPDVGLLRSTSVPPELGPRATPVPLEMGHTRNGSGASPYPSVEYSEQQPIRRHDYDVQSMESSLVSPRNTNLSLISPPTVTVRSEFPTLTRSRQQQSLTCLVTVEVGEPKMRTTPLEMSNLPPIPQGSASEYSGLRSPPPFSPRLQDLPEDLERIAEELHGRVDNWHGLDFSRFGKLRLHGHIRVGKDRRAWQDLECYLFTDMLICVKERKAALSHNPSDDMKKPRWTLKGSILIKKHLKNVDATPEENLLTLTLSVSELPVFYLQFRIRSHMEQWKNALLDLDNSQPVAPMRPDYEIDISEDDDYKTNPTQRLSSINSSNGAAKSYQTAPTEYSNRGLSGGYNIRFPHPIHVPLDIVVVIPVSSSMQGLKITVLRDALRFLVSNLGERDRMGLVTFGSNPGGVPVVQMTGKSWSGWSKTLESIRPVGQKNLRADVVDGANVAMDLLMQRQYSNPLASILLISDSSTSDPESINFVVQRAEAAKVVIHSFGLGLTHKPDTMIELSTRTKASYTYVKDWMMLRECLAGVLGSLQATSHQNVKLKLRLPEGSPAKFVKISGAQSFTKKATGKDAEAALGDLRYGDKRDILVQLVIAPAETATTEQMPHDPWESIVSNLEALGGSLEQDEQRTLSIEEVPLIQADLVYGDLQRDGSVAQLPRPSLLAITMLPAHPRTKSQISRPGSPPIPPHPFVVQRRMELLTSDMMTRALTLVSRGQHDRAQLVLTETRTILKGLGKGSLPPIPNPPRSANTPSGSVAPTSPTSTIGPSNPLSDLADKSEGQRRTPSPPQSLAPTSPAAVSSVTGPAGAFPQSSSIDPRTVSALETELDSSLEWIAHPAQFSRDSRKAVLQAIGVISSQRAYTFRTPIEALWAERIDGIKKMAERARAWRELVNQQGMGDPTSVVMEE